MGSLIPPGLTLDCSLPPKPWAAKSMAEFLAEVSRMNSVSEKISKLDDYVNRLREEMKKIDAFKRELPLCMLLLNDAIATVKEETMQCRNLNPEPILEEFIPLKKSSSDEKDEKINDVKETAVVNSREKMNWMSSVQLGNSDNNKKRKEEAADRPSINELFQSGKIRAPEKAFSPFKRCSNFLAMTVGKESRDEFPRGAPSLSLRTPEIKNSTEEIFINGFSSKSSSSRSGSSNSQSSFKAESQQSGRKQRRCWSPELHRRFVSALQQLGGAQAATPKQIRELMQVDGLTNDEVKSHLQKYRLHTRRVPPPPQEQCSESSKPSNSQSSSPQGPLHVAGSSRGTSITGGDSIEEDDDEISESHSWKSHKHSSFKRESHV